MKLAIALDDVLCETTPILQEWERREGNRKFLTDTGFWGGLHPYDDVQEFGKYVKLERIDLYVFAARPKSVMLTTRTWIKNTTGIVLDRDHLVIQALKRYDCRLRQIQHFIDTNPDHLENLEMETVFPIKGYFLDRGQESLTELTRRVYESNRMRSGRGTSPHG